MPKNLPNSLPYFLAALFLMVCGYPIAMQLTGMWEVAFFVGGVGVALLVFSVVKQRFIDR